MKKSIVITTINSKSEGISKLEKQNKWNIILVGDKKSKDIKSNSNCTFLSINKQLNLGFKYSKICPYNSYSRKNIGYLYAVNEGSEIIFDTDDDNIPNEKFGKNIGEMVEGLFVNRKGWFNIYKMFTKKNIWPRGFPLEEIKNSVINKNDMIIRKKNCPVQQYLVNENPDVDAIYRMTNKLPVNFLENKSFILDKFLWSPFNSQSTVWSQKMYSLMYLPSYCSFRMTDIWRSFIAQRIMWENDWYIAFHSPCMFQKRNSHNLFHDFRDEIPGYINNSYLVKTLENINLNAGSYHIQDNLIKCYNALIKIKLIDEKELILLDSWLGDLNKAKST